MGGGSWWFRIVPDAQRKLWGVFRDDGGSKTKAYAIDSESQAKSMGKPVASWHHTATTLATGLYTIRDRQVLRCTGDAWLNIDQADASDAESKASFFVATKDGVYRHTLSDGPGAWKQIYSANLGCIEMVFSSKRKQFAIASHHVGAVLVDLQGRGKRHKSKRHKSEGGFWSVVAYHGSFFFYSIMSTANP